MWSRCSVIYYSVRSQGIKVCFSTILSSSKRTSMLLYKNLQLSYVKLCGIFREYTVLLCTSHFFKPGGGRWVISISSHSCCDWTNMCCSVISSSFVDHDPAIIPIVHALYIVTRSPIFQVYIMRLENDDTCHAKVLSLDQTQNLDFPISLCKGVHTYKFTCSISNFVSYGHLSSRSISLIAFVDSILVPKTLKETWNHLGWSDTMLDEIYSLEEITHGNGWAYPRKRNQWHVSGSLQLKWIHMVL